MLRRVSGARHHAGRDLGGLRSSLALSVVGRDVILAAEDLERRVALDAVLLAQIGLLGAVNLGELDVRVLGLEGRGRLLVLGGKGLAVAAPGGVDWRAMASAEAREAGGALCVHSARTSGFAAIKSENVLVVRTWTLEESVAEAPAAKAAKRPAARHLCCMVKRGGCHVKVEAGRQAGKGSESWRAGKGREEGGPGAAGGKEAVEADGGMGEERRTVELGGRDG